MGIFSRLSDIINSNITATLDRAEDPEKMIRMMIQEMEDTLVEVRSAAARVIADRKEAERRLRRLDEAQAEWQRKARLALAKGREDLARGALVEKARLGESAADLSAELEHLGEAMAKHEGDIVKLENKLREVKAKQKALTARHRVADSQLRVRKRVHDTRIDETLARFEQMEKRLDEAEGKVEVYDVGDRPASEGGKRSLSEEIEALEIEHGIAAELEALKADVEGRR